MEATLQHPEVILLLAKQCPDALRRTEKFFNLDSAGHRKLRKWLFLTYGRRLTSEDEGLLDRFLTEFVTTAAFIPCDLGARATYFMNAQLPAGEAFELETIQNHFHKRLPWLRALADQRGLKIPRQVSKHCQLVQKEAEEIQRSWNERVQTELDSAERPEPTSLQYFVREMIQNAERLWQMEPAPQEHQAKRTVRIEDVKLEGPPVDIPSESDVTIVSPTLAEKNFRT